jgi:predicted O-linked N-acetylglucosamine transferase (SPINDLY family)
MDTRLLVQCVNDAHAANARGDFPAAIDRCRQALNLAPELPEAWYNLGVALAGMGERVEAVAALKRAANGTAMSAEAQNDIGLQLLELGALDDAERCLERAIAFAPGYAFAHSNVGKLRVKQRRLDDAERAFRKAIDVQPDLAAAHVNLGGTLNSRHSYAAAEAATRRAIELDPRSPDAWRNRANALAGLGDYAGAAECGDRCLALDPYAKFLLGATIHNRMKACDWAAFDNDVKRVTDAIAQGEKASYPFPLLGLTADPAIQLTAAGIYAADEFPPRDDLGSMPPRPRQDRVRIGYFSADFRDHAVSILIAEALERHDRSRFEVFGFAFGRESDDEMRRRVRAACGTFVDARDMSDRDLAALARAHEVDIAIDLGGYTEDCRMGIFALRAAPIQVSYLGYLGTSGTPYIDYLIADRTIVPAESHRHYSERIVRLPSYQANDSKRRIAERTFSRAELGLPPEGIVFCNFCQPYKITPWVFDAWMRILDRVEGSTLLLYDDNVEATANLRKEAERRGIDPLRLVFAGRVPAPEYIARYRVADLFLDTHPYNGGTTASDALWAGLPVLTWQGASFASRVASSLLEAIRLPELVTTNARQYESVAIELARYPTRLRELKHTLAQNRLASPLFDTPRFMRHLEAAFMTMYDRYHAGLATDHIDVEVL